MIRCMDLYAVDWALDTGMQNEWYDDRIFKGDKTGSNPEVVANWAEYATLTPTIGQEDWITNADGTKILERDATQHLRYQYVCIRRDYFPEVVCARPNGIALAIAKYKGFYDQRANLNAVKMADPNADAFSRRASDWTYRWPNAGVVKPPVVI
jgi:hypothetical protein